MGNRGSGPVDAGDQRRQRCRYPAEVVTIGCGHEVSRRVMLIAVIWSHHQVVPEGQGVDARLCVRWYMAHPVDQELQRLSPAARGGGGWEESELLAPRPPPVPGQDPKAPGFGPMPQAF